MMTVIPTRTGVAGLAGAWWMAVRRALRPGPARPAAKAPATRTLLPPAPLTPEMRSEEDLRAAYRLWFGSDPFRKL